MRKTLVALMFLLSSGMFCQDVNKMLLDDPFVYDKSFTFLGEFTYSIQVSQRTEVLTGKALIYETPRYLYVYIPEKSVIVTYLISDLVAVNCKDNKYTNVWSLNSIDRSKDLIVVDYIVRRGTAKITYEKKAK